MSIKIGNILKYREWVFLSLSALVFIMFTVSYAFTSISIFLFIPFFFLDSKQRIKEKWVTIKSNKTIILFALFFLAQVVGILYSENQNFAIKKTLVMLPLFFLPAILSAEQLSITKYNKLLTFLKFAIPLIFSYYFLIHVFIDDKTVNTFVHFTVKEKLKISQFYLLFIIMIPIFESIRQIYFKNNIGLNLFVLIISLGILLLLGNKTTVVFLGILSLRFFYKNWKEGKKRGIVILLGIIILGSLGSQIPIIKNRTTVFLKTTDFNLETIITKNRFTHTKNTFEHRVLINYVALKEIKKSFPFGVGTGDYQDKLNQQYKKIEFKRGLAAKYNNHNQYVAEFLKTGALGGVLFLLLIISLLKKMNREHFFYSYFILFFAIGCLVESYLDRQHGVVIFAFMIPFFLKLETVLKKKPNLKHTKK